MSEPGPKYLLIQIFLLIIFASLPLFAQTPESKANYTDEISPLHGKPFKGRILKFDGTTVYFEIRKDKTNQIVVMEIDSLKEINKNFGPINVSIFNRGK